MRSYVIAGCCMVVLCVGLAWLLVRPQLPPSVDTVVPPPAISSTPVVFLSAEGSETVQVLFGTSTALLNGAGYSNLLMTQVEVASGAKYENAEENLSLWNKGDEVTVQRGRKILFVGKDQTSLRPRDAVITVPTATSTDSVSLSGTWLWVETIAGEQTLTPNTPDVFSVTFSDTDIRGTTDCNGFSGTYTITDDVISVGSLAMTEMFCEGSQEMQFTQLFIGSLTASFDGATLVLRHEDGTVSRFKAQ